MMTLVLVTIILITIRWKRKKNTNMCISLPPQRIMENAVFVRRRIKLSKGRKFVFV